MNLRRAMRTALIACALLALSIPMGTAAHAATSSDAAAAHRTAASVGCDYWIANLGYHYYEADKSRNLDWWAQGSASSGNPVVLESVSSSSLLDCFKVEAGFGGGKVQFQLAHSNLCLNIAGNSRSSGAWVILWDCTYHPDNELFYVLADGLADTSFSFQSVSSGLCVDLSNGYHANSILEQKPCKYQDIYQSWYTP